VSVAYGRETVAVLGLGLIGGSLARALRASGFSQRFIGYGYRERSLRKGQELGVIDEFSLDLDEVLARADIAVICAPTLVAADMLQDILGRLSSCDHAPVITDAASVKGNLLEVALSAGGGQMPANVVLGHPIAGSERSGVEASSAELFVNHRVILTPVEGNDAAAVALVRDMWRSTGAEVVDMAVADHDAVLAATSHLPHVLAYALVDALAQSDASADIFRFAAGGFRDFTRIASSDPVMWRDISIANREALLQSIDLFTQRLECLRAAVDARDSEQLLETFDRAKQARDQFAAQLAERNRSAT
jgi:cyclohexadieny/prephenate dehydrogenase